MNCNCCCTNTLNFCRQNICGEIDFDVLAQVSGVHKLVTYFLGVQVTIYATFAINEKIIFPINLLNENYQFTAEIYDPNGARVLIKKNDIDYDCFKFQTVLGYQLNQISEES